jgi:2-iminobutanoate/2-iminopropanoate deaminase
MARSIITTDGAPAAIGPYAQGVRVGNLIFTAGQGGLDPVTGQVVPGGFNYIVRVECNFEG